MNKLFDIVHRDPFLSFATHKVEKKYATHSSYIHHKR